MPTCVLNQTDGSSYDYGSGGNCKPGSDFDNQWSPGLGIAVQYAQSCSDPVPHGMNPAVGVCQAPDGTFQTYTGQSVTSAWPNAFPVPHIAYPDLTVANELQVSGIVETMVVVGLFAGFLLYLLVAIHRYVTRIISSGAS